MYNIRLLPDRKNGCFLLLRRTQLNNYLLLITFFSFVWWLDISTYDMSLRPFDQFIEIVLNPSIPQFSNESDPMGIFSRQRINNIKRHFYAFNVRIKSLLIEKKESPELFWSNCKNAFIRNGTTVYKYWNTSYSYLETKSDIISISNHRSKIWIFDLYFNIPYFINQWFLPRIRGKSYVEDLLILIVRLFLYRGSTVVTIENQRWRQWRKPWSIFSIENVIWLHLRRKLLPFLVLDNSRKRSLFFNYLYWLLPPPILLMNISVFKKLFFP